MFEYEIDGETIVIPREELKEKLSQNPGAKFVKEVEPGNTDPSPETKDAPVEENNTASDLETGSLDLQKQPVPKNLYGEFAEPYLEVLQNVEGKTAITPPFTKSTLDLFNNESSTEDVNTFFKNEFIPSKFTYNAILKDIEDLDPKNPTKFIESYSDDLKKFKSLDTDSKNKIVQDFYNILTKDTNPVGKIFNNEIQKSYDKAIQLTKTQISDDRNKIENEWLNTEQGKRQKQLADTYGVNFEEFTGEEINAANIFNEYFGLRSTQEKFFNDKIKEIELDKKSEKLLNDNFNKIAGENDALKSIDKRIVQSSLNFIDEFGNVLNREELGLDLKYGPISVGYELIKKQEAQVGSGYLQKFKIEPTKKRIDNIKDELKSFEDKGGNDMVAFRYNNKAYKMTRNKAEEFLYKEQEKETLELLKAFETDEELTRLTETYANDPRFLNEIDFNQPAGSVIGDIIKGSPQALVDVGSQVALTLGFGMVIQEAGFSFKDQLASTIKKNENQINDYLNDNNLNDSQVNKQKAAINLGLMSENSELISNIVGVINGFLELLPFKKLFRVAIPNSLTKKIGKQIVDKSKEFLSLGKNLAEIPAIEFITEIGQGIVTDIGTAAADNIGYAPTKQDLMSYLQEGTRGAQAVLIPAGGAAFSRINRQSLLQKDFKNNKEKKDYIQNLKDNNKQEFDGGFITKELYEQNNVELDAFEKIEKKLDSKLKGQSRIEAASLLYRKSKLEEIKQEKDSTQQESVNQELESIDERLTSIVKEEFSIAPEPTATISTKNQQLAQKNKELMAIIKDERTDDAVKRKTEGDLYINNQGLINDVVNKKFDPSKDTGLQRESLVAEANLAFVELMRTFTPAKGEFGAYARRYINLRLNKSIAELTGSQKNPETGKFEMAPKQDITETQVEDTIADDSSQVLEKVGTKLKTEFGLEEETVGKIKEAVKKVFGTSLPAVTDKNFKKKTVQAFKDELTDLVKRDGIFGKDSQEFTAFLEDNAEAIYNSLPLEVVTKSFSQFTEKQIDPKTGKPFRERTEVGKEIFVKKDFNDVKDEFINYFTDRGLKSAARSDRKTSIATQIADQLARDEVVGVLSDPKIAEKFKAVQELEGKKVPEDYLDRIVRELDRGLEWLQKQQQSDTLRFSLVVPELAAKALELFLKTFIAALKNPKVQKAAKQVGKNTTALSIALKEAIKAVQDKYGNWEINPAIEKAIRDNVNRTREGIDINEENLLYRLEDEFSGSLAAILKLDKKYTELFRNPKEIKKAVKIFNDSIDDIINIEKETGESKIADILYVLGKTAFGDRSTQYEQKKAGKPSPKGYTIFNPKSWDAWFNKKFKGYKPPKTDKYKVNERKNDKEGKNYLKIATGKVAKGFYARDKVRAADAEYLYRTIAKYAIENGDNNQIAMILKTLGGPMEGITRLMAPIVYNQRGFKPKTGKQVVLEHLNPVSYIDNMMLAKYKFGINIDIDKIFKDHTVAIIDKKLAADLNANGLRSNQSKEYENGKNHVTKRIFNEVIKKLNKYDSLIIENMDTSEIFGFNDKIIKEEQSKLGTEFNQILEESKGIEAGKEYSEAQGRNIGRKANKLKIFVPYSAEDLLGLLYRFAGQGKQGDAHLKWIKDNISTPLTESFIRFEVAQQAANNYLKEAKNLAAESGIDFTKEAIDGYTVDQAIRIHIWSNSGYNLEKLIGMKDDQVKRINNHVRQNFDIKAFESAIKDAYISNDRKYPPPKDNTWISGTITTDLLNFTNTITREEAFKPFYDNIEAVFGAFDKNKGKLSGANLNKVKAIYGTNFVKALESSLYRIHTGRNRSYNLDQQGDSILNWTNNAIGNIMFFNTRSAVLQTLSNVNFTNWSDNNPFEIAKAWGNANQFKKDFVFLFNSDYLKSRRSGLKTDINEQEIATAVNSSNRVEALLAAILKKGFLPTQMADSFAIALGGATFYRNRTNKYKNDGMSQKEAEEQAFKDFREISEDSQQSSRPDKISMEQAGFAGRLILAFQNTPMQYNRLAKKAMLDLINGRGDTKTNVTKIIWYLGVQNAIFYASQQALFSILFDSPETDDEEKREKERYFNLANGMADSVLRGSGVYGAILSTGKNTIIEILKKGTKEEDIIKALSAISPPINSKIRKVYSISKKFIYKQELKKMKELGLDSKNPAIIAGAEALSVGINLPADRAIKKINNLRYAFEEETQWWQSVALALGWSPYDVNIDTYEKSTKQPKPKLKGLSKKRNSKSRLKRKRLK